MQIPLTLKEQEMLEETIKKASKLNNYHWEKPVITITVNFANKEAWLNILKMAQDANDDISHEWNTNPFFTTGLNPREKFILK